VTEVSTTLISFGLGVIVGGGLFAWGVKNWLERDYPHVVEDIIRNHKRK
jgi:hypothetical protein